MNGDLVLLHQHVCARKLQALNALSGLVDCSMQLLARSTDSLCSLHTSRLRTDTVGNRVTGHGVPVCEAILLCDSSRPLCHSALLGAGREATMVHNSIVHACPGASKDVIQSCQHSVLAAGGVSLRR